MKNKICMDCKWCSYNYEQRRIKAIKNPIKRFFAGWNWEECYSKVHREFPKCKHPDVYIKNNEEAVVFGDQPPARDTLNCAIAREESFVGWQHTFSCCGKEGKYWEAKDE